MYCDRCVWIPSIDSADEVVEEGGSEEIYSKKNEATGKNRKSSRKTEGRGEGIEERISSLALASAAMDIIFQGVPVRAFAWLG